MRFIKLLLVPTVAAAALLFTPAAVTPRADAQVSIGVNIGPEPVCPYGYYGFAPYRCAPYGYYGPEWFNNGVFFGVGPWFHGPAGFHGYVNHRYEPRYGYRGGFPANGEHFDNHHDFHDFHGTAQHDFAGHEFHGGHGR